MELNEQLRRIEKVKYRRIKSKENTIQHIFTDYCLFFIAFRLMESMLSGRRSKCSKMAPAAGLCDRFFFEGKTRM